jgi:hypothetical protein
MDYIHQTVDSAKLADIFNLPVSLKSRKVEVIVLPLPDTKEPATERKSAFGCLQKYANASLISEEEGAWERAVVEKYAGS